VLSLYLFPFLLPNFLNNPLPVAVAVNVHRFDQGQNAAAKYCPFVLADMFCAEDEMYLLPTVGCNASPV